MPEGFDPAAALTGPGGPFEVVTEDVLGISTKVYKQRMKTMRDVLKGSAGFADKDYIVQGDRRLSFEENYNKSMSAAATLVSDFGFEKGDRLAILAANRPEWSIAFWAPQAIGSISVPLNAWWKSEELTYALEDSGTRFLVCDRRRFDVVRESVERLDFLKGIFVIDTEPSEYGESIGGIDVYPIERLFESDPESVPNWEIDEDDYASIFYTSGTTGKPKGAISSQRNIIANLQNVMYFGLLNRMVSPPKQPEAGAAPGIQVEMATLNVVPFFHVTGCFTVLIIYLALGGKVVLMPAGRFDATEAMRLIQDEKVSSFGGVPTVAQRIVEHPDFEKYDLSTVNQIVYGGAPPPIELAKKVREKFPNVSSAGGAGTAYGLTESAAVATLNVGDSYFERPDSAGKPMPVVELKIVGEDGSEVAPGERGEILIKGPTVSPGYWKKPEATAETFTEGWLHSGDIGIIDEDGWLYVVDRAKDMIIRGGENIYCIEIEDVVYTHPDVAECAVIGVPHPDLGEEVKVIIVPRQGQSVSKEEIQKLCAHHLADFKVPAYVELSEKPLPRNPAGKVLKQALRGGETSFDIDDEDHDSAL